MIRIDTNDNNLILEAMPTNWGAGVWRYNGILFTGIVYEYFPNTDKLWSELEFKDDILDGRQAEYWPNGKLKEEYFKKYDYYVGSFKLWDEQGVLISYSEYDQFGNRVKKII